MAVVIVLPAVRAVIPAKQGFVTLQSSVIVVAVICGNTVGGIFAGGVGGGVGAGVLTGPVVVDVG